MSPQDQAIALTKAVWHLEHYQDLNEELEPDELRPLITLLEQIAEDLHGGQ